MRAALRIARRDSWRAKGRSLLIIALIGLPVFVLAGADIAVRTWQLGPAEKIERTIGAADLEADWYGGQVGQAPAAWLSDLGISSYPSSERPTKAGLLAALPPGSRVIERHVVANGTEIRTADGLKHAELIGLDYADPIAKGLVHQESGRAPRNAGEVSLTSTLASSVGRHVGDRMRLVDLRRDVTVVGIVTDASHRHAAQVYTLPDAVSLPGAGDSAPDAWLVDSPKPITWQQVLHLNKFGYAGLSRSVYLDPPPRSQWPPEFAASTTTANPELYVTLGLVAGLALFEVVLLAGPAFAVSARRQRYDLALMAAVGARRSDLRNLVLANGVVLGLAAGVLSVLGGLVAAAIGIPLAEGLVDARPGHFDVQPLELGGVALLSLLTALAAAVFPARAAARTDVIATLGGRAGTLQTRKRVPVLGCVVAMVGAVVAIGGASASSSSYVILAGVALVEVGLIICTPALLGLAARLGKYLPLAARIALRDAGRNRSSAAPAVAAVMAAVIGAVAIVIGVASNTALNRHNYQAALATGDGYVSFTTHQQGRASDVAAALRGTLPTTDVLIVRGPNVDCAAADPVCVSTDVHVDPDAAGNSAPTRYRGGRLPQTMIDDGSSVKAVFGLAVPQAVAALRAGKAVVVDKSALHNGMVTVTTGVTSFVANSGQYGPTAVETKRVTATIPAVAVESGSAGSQLILPPSLAPRLGITPHNAGVLAIGRTTPSERETQAANGALNRIDDMLTLYVESGYHDANSWLLYVLIAAAAAVAVGAAVIATALANVDGRADLVTLAAVGASPRTVRVLSMARAGVIAGIGTAIGILAGFVPPAAWVEANRSASRASAEFDGPGEQAAQMGLVVPWLPLVVALIGIPLVAALVVGLFTRSRLPVDRAT